jgi:hypothetical protein
VGFFRLSCAGADQGLRNPEQDNSKEIIKDIDAPVACDILNPVSDVSLTGWVSHSHTPPRNERESENLSHCFNNASPTQI